MLETYSININEMNFENYTKFFKGVLYPIEGSYRLRMGLRSTNSEVTLVIDNVNASKHYKYKPILVIEGDEEKLLKLYEEYKDAENLNEKFRQLWNN